MAADGTQDLFEIVVLCTGNRFRSPLVAAFLRERTRHLPVRVESAGTLDVGRLPALDGAAIAAREHGLDLTDHLSRFVGRVSLTTPDLILGFERMHVVTAVVEGGAPRERVFTLPELVSLLERFEPPTSAAPVERARASIGHANRLRRGAAGLRFPEVADPIGTSPREQRQTALELLDLSARLVAELFGVLAEGVARQPPQERLRGRG
jgi:protein-tyrosine phosphatase